MKTAFIISTAIVLSSTFAQAAIGSSKAHKLLCKQAVAEYPEAFAKASDCLKETDIESGMDEYQISFMSCSTGEWVTITLDYKTGETLSGSSGLESDMCE